MFNTSEGVSFKLIDPDDPGLLYCGRISRGILGGRALVFPCSFVKWRFTGDYAAVDVGVERFYFDVYAGVIIDGKQYKVRLDNEGRNRIELLSGGQAAAGLERVDFDGSDLAAEDAGDETAASDVHEIMFFKRQDACNVLEICGIVLDGNARLLKTAPLPGLKMEVYGDSVSAGEVSEAVDRVASPDPEGHEGIYSNSWFSFSWITARKLGAGLHDIAQGGIALLDGTGWFAGPDYIGMESIYDKSRYYPDIEHAEDWNFDEYIPDIVVLAFGQNDANPTDFMKEDYDGEKAVYWRERYRRFISLLREKYPSALIICATTILNHDPSWDRAIEEAVQGTGDKKVLHFLFSNNGCGTPGHIRIPEAERMAQELSLFIQEHINTDKSSIG